MSPEAAVILALVAFLVGIGASLVLRPLATAPAVIPHSPPGAREGLEVIRGELLDDARSIALVHVDAAEVSGAAVNADLLAGDIAAFAADQWSRGIADTRDALVHHSGLEPDLAEDLANLAIEALEQERGLVRA